MTPPVQSILALLIVAAAAGWLGWRWWSQRRRGGSCGSGECGAISRDVRKLQAHLRKQR